MHFDPMKRRKRKNEFCNFALEFFWHVPYIAAEKDLALRTISAFWLWRNPFLFFGCMHLLDRFAFIVLSFIPHILRCARGHHIEHSNHLFQFLVFYTFCENEKTKRTKTKFEAICHGGQLNSLFFVFSLYWIFFSNLIRSKQIAMAKKQQYRKQNSSFAGSACCFRRITKEVNNPFAKIHK